MAQARSCNSAKSIAVVDLIRGRVKKQPSSQRLMKTLSLLLLGVLFVALSIVEPLEEGLSGFANFLADGELDVFLAGFGTPGFEHGFGDEILLIKGEQDLRNLRDELGMLVAHETFGPSEQSFFVALGGDHLLSVSEAKYEWICS